MPRKFGARASNIKKGINSDELERMVQDALSQANKNDLNPEFIEHLQELKNRLE